jgi:prevent-host-death family protein
MTKPRQRGAEEARSQLPALLDAAEQGRATVITRRGKPVAALVPIDQYSGQKRRQMSVLDLRGSGRGLWGKDSTQFIRDLRDEWDR